MSWEVHEAREYLRTALPPERQPYWVSANKPQPSHGVNGPEMMELMRQQAVNFGTRIITEDILRACPNLRIEPGTNPLYRPTSARGLRDLPVRFERSTGLTDALR